MIVRLLKDIWNIRLLYLLFLPAILYFILFKYIPKIGIVIAFKDYSPFLGIWGSDWVGLAHFNKIFSDPYFYNVLKNTFILASYGIFIGFPVPIIAALMLNEVRSQFFKRFVQSATFFPYFVSSAVAVSILYSMFSPQDGVVNNVLNYLFQIKPIYFMSESQYFRTMFTGLTIWHGFGYNTIIYLAALAAIDPHLYEAAEVDGANRWRKIWHITLPGISNTIIVMFILRIGHFLSLDLETVLLMYNPSVYDVADVIPTYVYRTAFPVAAFPNFSYAAAVGLFQSVIAIVLIVAANFAARKYSEIRLF